MSEQNIQEPAGPVRLVLLFLVMAVGVIGLYMTTWVNYLLFHSLAEIFSIVVAFSLFTIAWNSREHIKNPYLLFIGIAYLFIGTLDLLHTLSYKGMAIFTDYDFYANQLWIGARYMESVTLLLGFIFLKRRLRIRPWPTFAGFSLVTALIIASIFYWKIFPECFVAGKGLTPFKKNSEYAICGILLLNIFLLWRNRERFELKVYRLLLWALICTIISELAFTFYISNYGFSNLLGHYFKLFSFYLVYQALVKTGISDPEELIFRELDKTNQRLTREIEIRKKAEQEKEKLIAELKNAAREIKNLQGILPICSVCKNIRDENGKWHTLEDYISGNSDADLSHGICPKCMKTHYPGYGDE